MDIDTIYGEIISRLKSSGNDDIAVNIEKSAVGAATGGEGLGMTGAYLLSLKYSYPVAFELIRKSVADYEAYCRKYGVVLRR